MKKKILLTASAISAVSGYVLYSKVKSYTKSLIYRNTIKRGNISDLNMQEMHIKNNEGLVLYGYLLEKENADKTLVMLHGLDENVEDLKKYIPYFERVLQNTNIVLLDLRGYGNSDGLMRGFGYKDLNDLALWNKYLIERFNNHSFIYYGKNIGANTILNAAGSLKLDKTKAIISDGAYNNLLDYLSSKCFKKFKLDKVITMPIIRNVFKKEVGYSIDYFDSVKYVKHNKIPTIYIHSKYDNEVPFKHVFDLYNQNSGEAYLFPIKEKYFYEMNQDEEYSRLLEEFLNKYV